LSSHFHDTLYYQHISFPATLRTVNDDREAKNVFIDIAFREKRRGLMSARFFRILVSLNCMVGVLLLITSFVINPSPPSDSTPAQLVAFADRYHTSILIGSWLQAISPILIVFFGLSLAYLADATRKLVGSLLLFGSFILVLVSLIEVTFYLTTAYNPVTVGMIGLDIIRAVQHLYSMVAAPLLFFPLAVILLGSHVLPRVFGYLALVLGGAFAILGMLALFSPIQYIVDYLAYTQGLWWLSAALALLISAFKQSDTATSNAQGTLVEEAR
jgi:hypothetical protein